MQRYERDMWYNVSGATAKKIAHEMEHKEDDKKIVKMLSQTSNLQLTLQVPLTTVD